MQVPTITDSASASGKANPSTLCVRWLKARSDHGPRTSTTRCTWTDSPRSSEDNRLIPADPIRSQARSAGWVPRTRGCLVGDLRSETYLTTPTLRRYESRYESLTAAPWSSSPNEASWSSRHGDRADDQADQRTQQDRPLTCALARPPS